MKIAPILEPLAEVLTIVLIVMFFLVTVVVLGCDRSPNPIQIVTDDVSEDLILQQIEFAEEEVGENMISVSSKSYKIIAHDDALRVHRIDIAGHPRVAMIDLVEVSSIALYETSLFSVGHPVALLVVGVSGSNDGKGAAHVFSVSPERVQLQEEITPYHSSTFGFGNVVQFEHVDDAGWWLCVESVKGESYNAPIGRWF